MGKPRIWLAFMLILCAFNTSCGVLHPPHKHNGMYTVHFSSCGPQALEKALTLYAHKNNIKYKRTVSARELSIEIQDRSKNFSLRDFLVILHKEAAAITSPGEIKQSLDVRGIKIKQVSSIDELDIRKDIAIILIHKKGTLTWYHWLVYPSDILMRYGDKTVIDKIYLLEPIK